MASVVAAPLRRRSASRLLHGFAADRRCGAATTLASIMSVGRALARGYSGVWIDAVPTLRSAALPRVTQISPFLARGPTFVHVPRSHDSSADSPMSDESR